MLLVATGAHAQAAADTGRVLVKGIVVDASTGRGIADAQLSAISGPAPTRTDSLGHFGLEAHRAGAALVLVRRFGYAPHVFTIELADAPTREYVLELDHVVPTLDTVTVKAVNNVARTRHDVFDIRRRTSVGGHFVTREDILRRGAAFTSDAVLGILGVHVNWDQYGRAFVTNTRDGCRFRMGVDGVLIEDFDLDQILPDEVHGIEIYSGPASVPIEYLGSHRITCGLVMVWTR